MTGPAGVFALALLWAVVVYRTRTLMRPGRRPETWAIWGAVAPLAVAATLYQPTVYHVVDTAVGIANLAELAGHAMIMVAAWQAQTVFVFLIYPRTPANRRVVARVALVVITVALMATFFALAPVDRDVPLQFTTVYANAPWIVPYWVAFLFTVNVILIDMVRLVLRYAKRTNREHLRFGLQLVAIGGVLGVGYWCQWVAFLVLRHIGVHPPAPLHAFGMVCEMGGVFFSVVGSVYPAIGARLRLRTPPAWWDDLQHYRQLYPMWQALTAATPEIVLAQPPRLPLDTRFWLNRRVIEIEDGLLHLGRRGRFDGEPAGSRSDETNPEAEARAIQEALRTRTAGAAGVVPAERASDVDGDYSARVAWQLEVSRAFARLSRAGQQPLEQTKQ